MSFDISPADATVFAASLAALVSIVGVFYTVRTNKIIAHKSLFSEEVRETRRRLRQLAKIMGRVDTSVRRLLGLAPSLGNTEMMEETCHTLAIVSDFFRASGPEEVLDFPHTTAHDTAEVRKLLTEFFLELDLSAERRASKRLTEISADLSAAVQRFLGHVREHVIPS